MKRLYVLRDRFAIPIEDRLEWAMWFVNANRTVSRTESRSYIVSTVFTGQDRSDGTTELPLLFETMVLVAEETAVLAARYSLWDEAANGHQKTVDLLEKELTLHGALDAHALRLLFSDLA